LSPYTSLVDILNIEDLQLFQNTSDRHFVLFLLTSNLNRLLASLAHRACPAVRVRAGHSGMPAMRVGSSGAAASPLMEFQ